MKTALAVTLLALAAPGGVLAGADSPPEPPEEPRMPPAPPALDALLDTAEDVSAHLYGHGPMLEARVGDDQAEAVVSVRTARGWFTHPLGHLLHNGTDFAVEDFRLVDVVGDEQPELWLEVSSYHAPCACDDGPVFQSSAVTICRITQRGLSCADPIEVHSYEHVLEEVTWTAALSVSRRGIATLRKVEGRGARSRSFRLFR